MTRMRHAHGFAAPLALAAFVHSPQRAHAQFGSQPTGFLGQWCAQGDPSKRASISANGPMLTLTNENGDTSPGQYQGQTGITAPGWQFVNGNLSPDGQQINWSNGTFWARCNGGSGGGGQSSLSGTWYAQGDRSKACSITQRRGNL